MLLLGEIFTTSPIEQEAMWLYSTLSPWIIHLQNSVCASQPLCCCCYSPGRVFWNIYCLALYTRWKIALLLLTFTGLKVTKVSIWIMDLETTDMKRELCSLHLQCPGQQLLVPLSKASLEMNEAVYIQPLSCSFFLLKKMHQKSQFVAECQSH